MIRQRNRSGVTVALLSTVEWSVHGCRTSISALYYNLCAGVSHVRCTFDWVDRLQLEYIYCCTSNSFALSPTFCNVGTPGYHVSVNRFRQSILFEYPFCHRYGAIFIGMIVAAVYLFFPFVSIRDSDPLAFCSLYGGTWQHCIHANMFWSDSSPVTCVQALYYYTHQNDSWYIKLSVRSSIQIFCLQWFWVMSRSLLLYFSTLFIKL